MNTTGDTAMLDLTCDVIIMDGLHQYGHGKVIGTVYTTTIPFARINLRGTRGQLLATRFALVPLKYCRPLDDDGRALLKRVKAEKAQARKAARTADIAATIDFTAQFRGACDANRGAA